MFYSVLVSTNAGLGLKAKVSKKTGLGRGLKSFGLHDSPANLLSKKLFCDVIETQKCSSPLLY